MRESICVALALLVIGFIEALVIVEIIRRRWPIIKDSLVAEYEPTRDGPFDEQDLARRTQG